VILLWLRLAPWLLPLQRLCRYLQQREDERRQRLHSSQLTATAVEQAHNQLRLASTLAAASPAAVKSTAPTAPTPRALEESSASMANNVNGNGSCNQPLPGSSAAGAAAAIASAGGLNHAGLPSQLKRAQVPATTGDSVGERWYFLACCVQAVSQLLIQSSNYWIPPGGGAMPLPSIPHVCTLYHPAIVNGACSCAPCPVCFLVACFTDAVAEACSCCEPRCCAGQQCSSPPGWLDFKH